MTKRNCFLILAAAVLLAAAVFRYRPSGEKTPPMEAGEELHTAEVNGVSIRYETAGEEKPVILLHGNGGSHEDLYTEIRALSEAGYKVYAPDSRGQGANPPLEEYHYSDMADDVYELIRLWGLEKPALYGWSDGGIVGLMLEIRHPGTLGALAASGANVNPEGIRPELLEGIRLGSALSLDPLTEMIVTEPDITEEELSSIRIPVLITAGSDDMILEDHTRMIAGAIPDCELMILEGEDHGSYIAGSERMGGLLIDFFRKVY